LSRYIQEGWQFTNKDLVKITQSHVDFWARKKGPKFLQEYYREKDDKRNKSYLRAWVGPLFDINDLIPSEKMTDGEGAASNLLNLCRSYRKRGELREKLRRLAVNPGTVIQPQKRAAYAKKWLKRIEDEQWKMIFESYYREEKREKTQNKSCNH